MAAVVQRVPHVGEKSDVANRVQRFLSKLEPWYDWGNDATIFRLDTVEHDFSDESVGEGFEFRIQWFGYHFGFIVGRTPPKIGCADVAARKLAHAQRAAHQDVAE